jgi:hypothetical protein
VHVRLFLLLVVFVSVPSLFVWVACGCSWRGFKGFWLLWFRMIWVMILMALGASLLLGLFALA